VNTNAMTIAAFKSEPLDVALTVILLRVGFRSIIFKRARAFGCDPDAWLESVEAALAELRP